MGFFGIFRSRRHERAGFALYQHAVQAARRPWLYSDAGVPDTLDGRFDVIGLHVALLVRRLHPAPTPGPALAQAVFDAMFSDMDFNLREMGVGELSVGKKVKVMWEAFHGRAKAYDAALASGDRQALETAIGRNLWRGDAPPEGVASIAEAVLRQDAHLAGLPLDQLARGEARFLDNAEFAR